MFLKQGFLGTSENSLKLFELSHLKHEEYKTFCHFLATILITLILDVTEIN